MNALALVIENKDYVRDAPAITIAPTVAAHIRELQGTIRDEDRREIEIYGFSCAKGLWRSYKVGLMNRTALVNGKVAACWGCGGTYMGSTGQPWLLTSYEAELVSPLKFARIYQQEVFKMLELFPVLENYVAADYEKAARLLEIIGFTLGPPEILGAGLYRKFTLERPGMGRRA